MSNVIKTVLTYQLDGSNRDFNIPFEYLARKFVVVTLIGVDRKVLTINTDYRFATRNTISLTKAWGPADGYTTIELRRVTSTTDRLVDFTDGSILRAYDLNVAQIQTMHVAEEARDLTADTIGVNNDGHLDARGRRIVNLANSVDDRDAVPFGQLKTMNQNSWQARNEALQFRNEAETFRNQAEGFKNESGTTATKTNQWRNEAEGFRDEAEQFKNASGRYADAAGSYAGNAKDSEDEARRIAASIREAGRFGYITRQSFEKGFNVTVWNEVLLWEEEGEYYRWDGTLPKNVPAGSTPETAGGVGSGAWLSVGDATLRSQLNNSFSSIAELRASKNLNRNIPVSLSSYYEGIDGGGGSLYIDGTDSSSEDNGGTVFVNASGQRIKRILDGVCRWSDFGILPGMPTAPTKSQCEAVWAWGFANGCKRYETFQKGEMTFTFPMLFQVPANWTGGAVSFIAEGLHKFAYDFTKGATNDVVEIILKLEDLSGKTPIHTIYNFDNIGMGRFPGKNFRYTALRHTSAKNSMIKVTGKNNYGYALFIGGSDNSIVYNSTFYNCDGQLLVNSPAGSYDNFGDAIYVAAKNVSIQSPVIETTQGGRAGIVFEGTGVDLVGGEVTNCFIKGYDRGIHIETVRFRMDAVNIIGGRILDCNTSILAFNGVTDDMASDMSVIVKGITSRLDNVISGHANPTGFSIGHLMVSGVNAQVTTEGCSWQTHQNNITVVGNGKWVSNGDRMFVNSGGIRILYTRGSEIRNMYAPQCRSPIIARGDLVFKNSYWGGDINIAHGNKTVIDNVEMSRQGGYEHCGRISLVGSNSAILRNIIFQYPEGWAIDNTQTLAIPMCPIIENIHVNSTDTGTATLLKNAEDTGSYANRYRRAMASYIANGKVWTTIS